MVACTSLAVAAASVTSVMQCICLLTSHGSMVQVQLSNRSMVLKGNDSQLMPDAAARFLPSCHAPHPMWTNVVRSRLVV
jgi:hypothetical protein